MSYKIDWTTLTPFIKVASGSSGTTWPSLTFNAPANGVFYATAITGAMSSGASDYASFAIDSTGGLAQVMRHEGVIEAGVRGTQCVAASVYSGAIKGQSYTFTTAVTHGSFTLDRPIRLIVFWLPGQQSI